MGRDDGDGDLPLTAELDAAADRFKAAWKAALSARGGCPPVIEDCLSGVGLADRLALLRELVRLDRAYRAKAGTPVPDDYAARFPEWAAAVRADSTVSPPPAGEKEREEREGFSSLPSFSFSPHPPDRHPSEIDLLNAALRPAGGSPPRYVAVEKLGEGGMGSVFKAEQRAASRGELRGRAVALKVIPLGMNSKQIVARFEAERQALALMNHQNIATVFDAGVLADGRPFFAMEHRDSCQRRSAATDGGWQRRG